MDNSQIAPLKLSRREFLKLVGGGVALSASGGLLAACVATPTAAL